MLEPAAVEYRPFAEIRRHWAVFLGLAIALSIWCAVDVARRARIIPHNRSLHMTDFTVYTEAGAAFFDGRDPYEVSNIRGWKYVYPPLFALMVSPLSNLPTPWQATVWFALSCLMAFGCYFECRRLLHTAGIGSAVVPPHSPALQAQTRSAPLQAQIHSPLLQAQINSPPLQGGAGGVCPPVIADIESKQSDATLGRRSSPPSMHNRLLLAALAATVFPALNCLQRGQMGIALLYFMLLGLRLVVTKEPVWQQFTGGVLLALPAALKLTPALPAGALLTVLFVAAWFRPRRDAANLAEHSNAGWPRFAFASGGFATGLALFLLLIPAALVGWKANLGYLHTWHEKVVKRVDDVRTIDFGEQVSSFRNQSLHNAVYRCGNLVAHKFFGAHTDIRINVRAGDTAMDAPLARHTVTAIRVLSLVVLAAVIVVAARSGDPLLTGAAFGLALIATLVVSPVSRGHYFVYWVPVILSLPLWHLQQGRARAAWRTALIPAFFTILHYLYVDWFGRAGLLGLVTTVWYFAACWQVLRRFSSKAAASHTDAGSDTQHVPPPYRAAAA